MRTNVWAVMGVLGIAGCGLSSGQTPPASDAGNDADTTIDAATDAIVDAGTDAGAPWAQVLGVLVPDRECAFDATESPFLLKGSYDVRDLENCQQPYTVAVSLDGHVPAIGLPDDMAGDATQVTGATVTLLDANGQPLALGPERPNPFSVGVDATVGALRDGVPGRGVAMVRTIPTSYRDALATQAAANATIIAEIRLSASTAGGEPVVIEPFRYPIELCVGCLSFCASELTQEQINTALSTQCPDNAGSDGRLCIDHSC